VIAAATGWGVAKRSVSRPRSQDDVRRESDDERQRQRIGELDDGRLVELGRSSGPSA